MEKKEVLGVRKNLPHTKRRRKVTAGCGGGGGRGSLAKAIAAYLASDSFLYAPLVSDSPQDTQPPAVAAPSSSPAAAASPGWPPKSPIPGKEVALVEKYRGSWRGTFTAC